MADEPLTRSQQRLAEMRQDLADQGTEVQLTRTEQRQAQTQRRLQAEHREREVRRSDSYLEPPRWTTGQGIGFLVALPGTVLAIFGIIGLMTLPSVEAADQSLLAGVSFGTFVFGLVLSIPGFIVFRRCEPQIRQVENTQ